ncbi:hypothetical protein [Roseovarius sp. C03]|uniref:hypothetical protein n=1 Tax=Roseovarius sp. C03 TaxID=3449222 RepID=UPI003EDC31A0
MNNAVFVTRVVHAYVPSSLEKDEIEWWDRVIAKWFEQAIRIDNVVAFVEWKQAEKPNETSIIQAAREVDFELQNSAAELACITGRGSKLLTIPGEDLVLFGPVETKSLLEDTIQSLLQQFMPVPVIVANTEAALQRLRARPLAARLLAEAQASSNAASELVGYVRVFESAFAMKHNALKNRLHRFLKAGPLEIPKRLSDNWIQSRHKVAHARDADATKFSADVLASMPHCREAAFDVTVNKKSWGSESIERDANALSSYVNPKRIVMTSDHFCSLNVGLQDILNTLPTQSSNDATGFAPCLDRPEFIRSIINATDGKAVECVADRFGVHPVKFFEDAMTERESLRVKGPVPLFRGKPPTFNVVKQ